VTVRSIRPRQLRTTSTATALSVLAAVTLLAAACSNASVTSVASPTASAAASSAAVASAPQASALAGSPSPVASPTDSPEPSIDRHGIPELEALLPTAVNGIALERLSIKGPDFYKTGTDVNRSQLDELLKNLGKTVDDLGVADAGDPTGKAVFEIGIFRVDGAKPGQLLSEWVAFDQAAKPGRIKVSSETVDGRAVTKIVDSSIDVGGTAYAFAVGDAIYLVRADDPTLLSAALAALPKS
jgi:hypothetical protein